MLSRVADSLYWMARYMERTDSVLRMLKINYNSSQDAPQDFTWHPVLHIFTKFIHVGSKNTILYSTNL